MDRLQLGNVLWQRVFQPHLFRKDAEAAHQATIGMLVRLQGAGLLSVLRFLYQSPYVEQPGYIGRVRWRNRVGVAAGFDKHGEAVAALDAIGFGAIEVGTVVPRPQFGNERPRVFRYPDCRAIINRYGFNSVGAHAMAENLARCFASNRIRAVVGVSLGKNKDPPDNRAVDDYIDALSVVLPVLRPGRDYVKVNISSPNTPGLRDIFQRLDAFLAEFFKRASDTAAKLGLALPPVYLKIPPDMLNYSAFERIMAVSGNLGVAAIEATNTTVDATIKRQHGLTEVGGLSGAPLRELATKCLTQLNQINQLPGWHRLDLIGLGGIDSVDAASEKRNAGADAIQLYTGLIFEGPILLHNILDDWRRE